MLFLASSLKLAKSNLQLVLVFLCQRCLVLEQKWLDVAEKIIRSRDVGSAWAISLSPHCEVRDVGDVRDVG